MKTYFILILLLAISIPMAIKFGIENSELRKAENGPCILNLGFPDDTPLKDKLVPNNLENIKKIDAFQNGVSNKPRDGMVEFSNSNEDTSEKRIGQECQFGVCLPGAESPGTDNRK